MNQIVFCALLLCSNQYCYGQPEVTNKIFSDESQLNEYHDFLKKSEEKYDEIVKKSDQLIDFIQKTDAKSFQKNSKQMVIDIKNLSKLFCELNNFFEKMNNIVHDVMDPIYQKFHYKSKEQIEMINKFTNFKKSNNYHDIKNSLKLKLDNIIRSLKNLVDKIVANTDKKFCDTNVFPVYVYLNKLLKQLYYDFSDAMYYLIDMNKHLANKNKLI